MWRQAGEGGRGDVVFGLVVLLNSWKKGTGNKPRKEFGARLRPQSYASFLAE